jgi:Zn-dependent protease
MYGLYNYFDRIRKEFVFSAEEVKSLFIAILILSFVIGFNDGSETFVLRNWLLNYVNCIMIITLAILARESAQRLVAINFGHKVEFRLWGVGAGIALGLAVLSMGTIPLLVYGGFVMSYLPRQRLGHFRYGLSFRDMAHVAIWGNLANIILALFFKLFSFTGSPLVHQAMMVNIIMAAINMLPFPPLNGSHILFANRTFYVFSLALIAVASALMLAVDSVLWVIIGSLVLAGMAALAWEIFAELK